MTLEAVKKAIADLPKRKQTALLRWLEKRGEVVWDEEIERDFSPGGLGMPLLQKVKADVRAGKFKPMEAGRWARSK